MAPNLKTSVPLVDILPTNALTVVQSKYQTLDSTTEPQKRDVHSVNPKNHSYWELPSLETSSSLETGNDSYWESSIPELIESHANVVPEHDAYWDETEQEPDTDAVLEVYWSWETPNTSPVVITKPQHLYWEAITHEASTKTVEGATNDSYWEEENDAMLSTRFEAQLMESNLGEEAEIVVYIQNSNNPDVWEWTVESMSTSDDYWHLS